MITDKITNRQVANICRDATLVDVVSPIERLERQARQDTITEDGVNDHGIF